MPMNVTFEYGTDTKALGKAILYVLSLPWREVPAPAPAAIVDNAPEIVEPVIPPKAKRKPTPRHAT